MKANITQGYRGKNPKQKVNKQKSSKIGITCFIALHFIVLQQILHFYKLKVQGLKGGSKYRCGGIARELDLEVEP